MTPSPNDRQNSGISMREKQEATELLSDALRVLDGYSWLAVTANPVLRIRAAMAILDMKEMS